VGSNNATNQGDPELLANHINFNPAVDFDGNDRLTGTAGFNTTEYFIVAESSLAIGTGAGGFPLGWTATGVTSPNTTGFGFGATTGSFANEVVSEIYGTNGYRGGLDDGTISTIPGNEPKLYSVRNNAAEDGRIFSIFDGRDYLEDLTSSTFSPSIDAPYAVGGRIDNFSNFQGQVAELVSFSATLTPTERQKANSYLALKYGITLDQTVATDYVSSAGTGTLMWDSSVDVNYNENIFGI
jgi:hypothetical protein